MSDHTRDPDSSGDETSPIRAVSDDVVSVPETDSSDSNDPSDSPSSEWTGSTSVPWTPAESPDADLDTENEDFTPIPLPSGGDAPIPLAAEVGDEQASDDVDTSDQVHLFGSNDDAANAESDTLTANGETVSASSEEPLPAASTPNDADTAESPSASAAAAAVKPSLLSRLGLGDRFGRSSASDADESSGESGGVAAAAASRVDGFRGFLDPRLHMPDLVPHSRFIVSSLVLVLLMLMANSAGLALIMASIIVPILIVMTLTQHDVFEKEPNLYIAGVVGAGVLIGVIIGWLSAVIVRDQWFDGGEINFGAGGFGGRFAEAAGTAPLLVWVLCGVVLPTAAIVGIGAVPIVLRRWPQFRNEVMDGMIMAGASAAGLSIGLTLVMWYPMISGDGPLTSVSDWTYMSAGSVLLRPIVITLSGAMIGAGVWRYMMSNSTNLAIIPAIGGVLGVLLLTIGSVQLQSVGVWAEFLWTALVAAAVFVVYRRVLDQAVATDEATMGDSSEVVVCPSCHKVTPVGTFCALCGKPLNPAAAEAATA